MWDSSHYTEAPFGWRGARCVWVYDLIHERYPDANAAYIAHKRRVLEKADAVLCISSATRDDVANRYRVPSDRLRVVPLAHNRPFRALPVSPTPYPGGRPYILYVGSRGYPHKAFGDLLRAYAAWPLAREIDLVCVGQNWTCDERALLASRRVGADAQEDGSEHGPRALLLENLDDEALAQTYAGAEAFVYPSHYEGFGIPLLESMAVGCPVVASRIPSTLEVAGADVPFYFEPGQVEGLTDALDRALRSGRGERTERGKVRAAAFDWNHTATATLDVYQSLS